MINQAQKNILIEAQGMLFDILEWYPKVIRGKDIGIFKETMYIIEEILDRENTDGNDSQ